MHTSFGPIVLLGSGETSLAGGRIFETIAQRYHPGLRIAILETPAGFELNSPQVAGRVADFLKVRLQNYQPVIDVIPARKRGTSFSPDDPEIIKPLLNADMVFMGAGSPTYAVRQLSGSITWNLVRARHRKGAALVFASAATIAIGAYVVPVYEIYKVGEDVSCPPGLNLFSDFGLSVSCVPHWNNTDGGVDVDTSRCFIGMERFSQWCAMLPPKHTTLGLDEHTGVIIDFAHNVFSVNGVSSITLLKDCVPELFPAGSTVSGDSLGDVFCPQSPDDGIPPSVWDMMVNNPTIAQEQPVPDEVAGLLVKREAARKGKAWKQADSLRGKINALGWEVQDTPEGQKLVKIV